jgi:hypothetical protein
MSKPFSNRYFRNRSMAMAARGSYHQAEREFGRKDNGNRRVLRQSCSASFRFAAALLCLGLVLGPWLLAGDFINRPMVSNPPFPIWAPPRVAPVSPMSTFGTGGRIDIPGSCSQAYVEVRSVESERQQLGFMPYGTNTQPRYLQKATTEEADSWVIHQTNSDAILCVNFSSFWLPVPGRVAFTVDGTWTNAYVLDVELFSHGDGLELCHIYYTNFLLSSANCNFSNLWSNAQSGSGSYSAYYDNLFQSCQNVREPVVWALAYTYYGNITLYSTIAFTPFPLTNSQISYYSTNGCGSFPITTNINGPLILTNIDEAYICWSGAITPTQFVWTIYTDMECSPFSACRHVETLSKPYTIDMVQDIARGDTTNFTPNWNQGVVLYPCGSQQTNSSPKQSAYWGTNGPPFTASAGRMDYHIVIPDSDPGVRYCVNWALQHDINGVTSFETNSEVLDGNGTKLEGDPNTVPPPTAAGTITLLGAQVIAKPRPGWLGPSGGCRVCNTGQSRRPGAAEMWLDGVQSTFWLGTAGYQQSAGQLGCAIDQLMRPI